MLSRSNGSASLVDLLAGDSSDQRKSAGLGSKGAATAMEAAAFRHAARGSSSELAIGSAAPIHGPRPDFVRQTSSSSAKSLTARLQQQSAASSGSSTTSSASSGKTVGQAAAGSMRPASAGSGSTVGSAGAAGQHEVSPRSSIALSLANHAAATSTASHSRMLTRPANRRATSYTNGTSTTSLPLVASSASAAGSATGGQRSASHSSTGPPSPVPGVSSSSSISLPMAPIPNVQASMLHLQRPHSSLRTEWSDGVQLSGPSPPRAATSAAMSIAGQSNQPRRSSRDSTTSRHSYNEFADDADRSAPSSLRSHSPYFQPFPHHSQAGSAVASTSYSPTSAQAYHHGALTSMASPARMWPPPAPVRASSSPPRVRDFAMSASGGHTATHVSPLTASNIRAKGKETATASDRVRSRQTSSSSRVGSGDAHGDLSIDEVTTDLASEAGTNTWDVRETDRLRSTKDANGRKMINQYVAFRSQGSSRMLTNMLLQIRTSCRDR